MKAVDFILNGRCTRFLNPVISPVSASSPASDYWSSSEYSSRNAWNVNFHNGNVNNNNKYNTNYVRAVAALDDEIKEGWIEAFYDCCNGKYSSAQCTYYRITMERDILRLAVESEDRTYRPSTSFCFIVTRPRIREVFAANFRDRVVQHWIALRLNPLFEEKFVAQGNVSFNCRKGFGTLAATTRLAEDIVSVSLNYTREAWVGKFDIRSFFMSIDKQILWSMLEKLIDEKYLGRDKDTLKFLTKVTVFHAPQNDCERQGDLSLWQFLPHHKSLFFSDPMVGMPIGNITSQLFANFYLSFFDDLMLQLVSEVKGKYERFVDDFTITAPAKEDILRIKSVAENYLKSKLRLTLHKDKVYLQKVTHGVKHVGQVIKPGRRYTVNSTIGGMFNTMRDTERLCEVIYKYGATEARLAKLEHYVSSLNSFNGFLTHTSSHNVRKKVFLGRTYFWKICYLKNNLTRVTIKKKYRLREYLYDRKQNILCYAGRCYRSIQQIPASVPHHCVRHYARP